MFDFTSPGKRKRVQAVLTNRLNQKCLNEMQGNERGPDRSAYVHALIAVPGKKRKWRFEEAFPVLSRDLSTSGMAVLHNAMIEGELLVEVPGDNTSHFVRCTVQHSNQLGFGYWHIGLKAEEIIEISNSQSKILQQQLDQFNAALAAPVDQAQS